MIKKFLLLALVGILTLSSCKKQSTEINITESGFAIYGLADSTITAGQAWYLMLDSITLSQSPILTGEDLVAYYWSTHSFTAHPNIDTLFSQMRRLPGKSGGVPFVVVAENSRIYLGAFWWAYSSSLPQGAYIMISSPSPYTIQFDSFSSLPDLRSDQRIYYGLKSTGILVE